MIMQSVIMGAPGLVGSAKVAIILILIYCCLSYMFFESEIQQYNDCFTAYQCIFKGFDAGLHGDFGGLHGDPWWNIFQSFPLEISSDGAKQAQWWLVTSFFILWQFIIAGIVQGYIVDAFSMIRCESTAREDDALSKCLICSLDKFELEHAGVAFDTHVMDQHNRWGYLYLATSVQLKPLDDHGTTESIIKTCLDSGATECLPLNTCKQVELRATNNGETEDEDFRDQFGSRLQLLEDSFSSMEENTKQLQAQLAALLDAQPPQE